MFEVTRFNLIEDFASMGDRFNFFISIERHTPEGRRFKIAKPLEFIDYDPQTGIAPFDDRAMQLTRDELRGLMDLLWEKGIRPSDATEPKKGELEATKYHLEDMRRLALKLK